MILSMTGFGKAETNTQNKKLTIEIKSLNSKQIDMSVRMPSAYRGKELSVRKTVGKSLNRGKIDVALFVEQTHSELSATINSEVVKAYYSDLKGIAKELDNTDDIMSSIMRLPDVLKSKKEEIVDIAQLLAMGDLVNGQKVFKKCSACHMIASDGKNMIGPNLWSVIGRKAGFILASIGNFLVCILGAY